MKEESKTIKDIAQLLRRAMWTDRKLPKVGLPYPKSPLGKITAIDDTQRSIEDILQDIPVRERPTKEDIENWERVMFVWLPLLDPMARDIVVKRCSGMGWKRLAFEINCNKSTAWRHYNRGLNTIMHHFALY